MRSWFFRRQSAPAAQEAYREGRLDEARQGDRVVEKPVVRERVVTAPAAVVARPRRRGFPLFTLLIVAVLIFGGVMLYLAAVNGSFSSGGAVVDQDISSAKAPIRNAEVRAGGALQTAGKNLKRDAGSPAS